MSIHTQGLCQDANETKYLDTFLNDNARFSQLYMTMLRNHSNITNVELFASAGSGNSIDTSCWTTVKSYEVPTPSPLSVQSGCGGTPDRVDYQPVTCHSHKMSGGFAQLSVVVPWEKRCAEEDTSMLLTHLKNKTKAQMLKYVEKVFITSVYSSVLEGCTNTLTFDKFSTLGQILDMHTGKFAYKDVSTKLMAPYINSIYGSANPDDLIAFITQTALWEYKDSLTAAYGNGCCMTPQQRIYGLEGFMDPSTGLQMLVLPDSFFKKDASGRPICFIARKGRFGFSYGFPTYGYAALSVPNSQSQISKVSLGVEDISILEAVSSNDPSYTFNTMLRYIAQWSAFKAGEDALLFFTVNAAS